MKCIKCSPFFNKYRYSSSTILYWLQNTLRFILPINYTCISYNTWFVFTRVKCSLMYFGTCHKGAINHIMCFRCFRAHDIDWKLVTDKKAFGQSFRFCFSSRYVHPIKPKSSTHYEDWSLRAMSNIFSLKKPLKYNFHNYAICLVQTTKYNSKMIRFWFSLKPCFGWNFCFWLIALSVHHYWKWCFFYKEECIFWLEYLLLITERNKLATNFLKT